MRSRRRVTFFAIALSFAAILAFVVFSRGPSEPSFKGRTINEWISLSYTNDAGVEEAFHNIGTNNLTLLVHRLAYDDSKDPVLRLSRRLPTKLKTPRIIANFITADLIKAAGAQIVLQRLGPLAAPALPELTQIASTGGQIPATRALQVLANIGEVAVPGFVSVMSNTNQRIRLFAITSLGSFTNSPLAARAITNALSDPDPLVRGTARAIIAGELIE